MYSGLYNVGVDLGSSYKKLKYPIILSNEVSITSGLQEHNSIYSIYFGYRWPNNIGTQLGASYLDRLEDFINRWNYSFGSKLVTGSVTQKGANFYLDGIYYHPISKSFDFKLIAGAGLLATKCSSNIYYSGRNYSPSKLSSGIGVRLGVGVQYNLSRDVSMDMALKLQVPGNSYTQGITWFTVGLTSYF